MLGAGLALAGLLGVASRGLQLLAALLAGLGILRLRAVEAGAFDLRRLSVDDRGRSNQRCANQG